MLVGTVAMVAGAAVTRADAALAGHRADAKASSDDVFASWMALTDDGGSADVRYTRTYRGVPVRGGDIR
jgi:hypothetical protein